MRRYIILTLLLSIFSSASLLDFKYLNDAKEAYLKKDYKKAEELYKKIENENAKFNLADTLYREKKYKEAIDIYNSIDSNELEFKKLYNIGNSYAKLNKIDDAIKSYEEALKIKEDKDTKFNLELLKKKKKQEQKKKNNKKENNQQQQNKNSQDKKSQKQDKKSQKKDKEQESRDKNSSNKEKDKKDAQKKEEQEKKREKQKAKMQENNKTQPPISNMEERKWQKMLNSRGVNTLMLPLSRGKGDKRYEKNHW